MIKVSALFLGLTLSAGYGVFAVEDVKAVEKDGCDAVCQDSQNASKLSALLDAKGSALVCIGEYQIFSLPQLVKFAKVRWLSAVPMSSNYFQAQNSCFIFYR